MTSVAVGSHTTTTKSTDDVTDATNRTSSTPKTISNPNVDVGALFAKAFRDQGLRWSAGILLLFALVTCLIVSVVLGVLVLTCFVAGLTLAIVLLQRRDRVAEYCAERWNIDSLFQLSIDKDDAPKQRLGADVMSKEPWKALHIDSDLDRAVDSFFSRILNTFIDSWYGQITTEDDFILTVRQHLREALSRLVLRVQHVDIARLCTERLLPACFAHYDLVSAMHAVPPDASLANGGAPTPATVAGLPYAFCATLQHTVHPAVRTRRAERDHLRALATFLVPRLCPNAERRGSLRSGPFGSLLRELFAGWALLPLMDVLADPNLINLLVLVATNRSSKVLGAPSPDGRVEFLARFVRPQQHRRSRPPRDRRHDDSDLLTDQTQMYSFMQYLKREGAVDVLRFYLDVDALNADLLDPKVTTDPAKLSALQQQSEKLLATYQQMQVDEGGTTVVRTLAEAHELVRGELLGRWQRCFRETAEYYRVVYGDREIRDAEELRDQDPGTGSSRISSKLKGALRTTIDNGTPLDGTEGAWDAYSDDTGPTHHHRHPATNNHNIYSSVTQKLRKERGHHRLDQFMTNFMRSAEHVPDLGVDATNSNNDESGGTKKTPAAVRRRTPPGRNPTFSDLFQQADDGTKIVASTITTDGRNAGASGCLIFILVRILNVPLIAMRFVLGIVAIARTTVDRIIGHLIDRLLRFGVYEPRLTMLITTLENHIFGAKKLHSDPPGQTELIERQRQARQRLGRIHAQLPRLVDVLQSPAMNKQLMYTLLDVVLVELWPELEPNGGGGSSSSNN